ncbi:MAG: hypothetical protein QOH41_2738 [Blastocatellia bacterium]|jgi:hypothetical protein|nr:hypothetical protein [Blastocatellia bacterium]
MGRVNAGHKLSEGEMRVLDIDGTKVSIAPLEEVYMASMTSARTWGARSERVSLRARP